MAKSKKRIIIVAAILALVLTVTGVGAGIAGIMAKYKNDKDFETNQVNAENFYFTVDLLGNTNTADKLGKDIHIFGTTEGTDQTLIFNVCNYFDSFRINKQDIQYKVSVDTVVAGVSLKRGSAVIAGESESYTIPAAGGSTQDEFSLTVPNKGYKNGDTVKITVKSSAPYKKTMTMNFILHTFDHDVAYRVEDAPGNTYAELIIMMNIDVYEKNIFVDWTSINHSENLLKVDCTNEFILDKNPETGNFELITNNPGSGHLMSVKITKYLKSLESISLYFFKSNVNDDYSTEKNSDGVYKDIGVEKNLDGTYTIELTEKGKT